MNPTEDEINILQEVQRLPSLHADICEYNKLLNQIISNSRNIYLLLSILKSRQDLNNADILEMLNIIFNLISINETSYNLELILSELLQIKLEDITLIQMLGKSISLISEILFLIENKFVLPINENKNTITPLEEYVFKEFLNYFSKCCTQNPKDFKETENKIKKEYIPIFVYFGTKLLCNQPFSAVVILKASLFFGIDESQSMLKKTIKAVLEYFQAPEIFQCLSQISTTGPEEAALDALGIVTILARTVDNWDRVSQSIILNIQQFILAVLADPGILNDQARAIEIYNLLIYVKPESKDHPFDNVVEFLYNFSQNVLQNSPLLLTIIYPGILSFFKAFKGNFSRAGLKVEFRERMKPAFIQYVDILLNSFEVNTDQTVESVFEIQNLSQIVQSLKRLLEFSDLSTIHLYIRDKTLQLVNDQITVVNSFKISFILIVLHSCFLEFELFDLPQNKGILFDLLFELFPLMESKLPQYSELANSTNTNFYLADFFLQAISTLLHQYFINTGEFKGFKQFQEYCQNSKPVEIIYIIFKFLLFMVLSGFEPRLASVVMTDVLSNPKLCQLLLETDLPNYFVQNYQNLPCKVIYYFAIVKFIFPDPQNKANFLQSLANHLSQLLVPLLAPQNEQVDLSANVARFFKIISTFFNSPLKSAEWFDFLQFIFANFGEAIEKIAENLLYSKYVLKFITKLTETKDGKKHLPQNISSFPSTSPFTFQIFKFFCTLLTKILKNVDVHPIDIDDSILTKPILVNDIYLGTVQLFTEVEDSDWISFSRVIRAMYCFMTSPFPNFAIMEYYKDACLLDFFNVFVIQTCKTTPTSLLSLSYVFDPLLSFISIFSKFYCQIILNSELFLNFILNITKVSFLSNNYATLDNSCLILKTLCREITLLNIPPLKRLFEQHFVLALNLLTVPAIEEEIVKTSEPEIDQEGNDENSQKLVAVFSLTSDFTIVKKRASKFLYWFLCNELDFASQLAARIVSGIADEEVKDAIDKSLNGLIHEASFNRSKQDRQKFYKAIDIFSDAVMHYTFRLDYVPSMSQFFMFK